MAARNANFSQLDNARCGALALTCAMSTPCEPSGADRLWTVLRRSYGALAFGYVMTLLAVAFLATSAAGAVLLRVLPSARRQAAGQAIVFNGFRFVLGGMRLTGLFHYDLSELDALRDARGVVIAPNHPSLLDVVLVASRVPRVVCIVKASLWNNPFLSGCARLAGYIRNDASQTVVRRAAAELRAGNNLLIFPEGTRTTVLGTPDPFKPGFALMARIAGAPVQTVFIESNSPYLRKGWPLLRMPRLPLRYRVRLGERFTPEQPAAAFIARLEAYYRTKLADAHGPEPWER